MNHQIGPIMFWSSDAASRSSTGGFSAQSGSQDGASIDGACDAIVLDYVLERLGPRPSGSLRAMVDYGLNDDEIGRYYGITPRIVERLRSNFGIADAN